jgi:hypothetical protein
MNKKKYNLNIILVVNPRQSSPVISPYFKQFDFEQKKIKKGAK